MALSVDEEERYERLAAESAREAVIHDKEALRMVGWGTISEDHRQRVREARSRARYYRRIARQQDF